MKTLIARLISTALMLIIPVYVFFPENIILQKLMLGNEFLHWFLLPIFLLAFVVTSEKAVKHSIKEGREVDLAYLRKLEYSPNWEGFILALDTACWLILVLLLNDWSFSIVLFLTITLSAIYNLMKRQAIELMREHDAKK